MVVFGIDPQHRHPCGLAEGGEGVDQGGGVAHAVRRVGAASPGEADRRDQTLRRVGGQGDAGEAAGGAAHRDDARGVDIGFAAHRVDRRPQVVGGGASRRLVLRGGTRAGILGIAAFAFAIAAPHEGDSDEAATGEFPRLFSHAVRRHLQPVIGLARRAVADHRQGMGLAVVGADDQGVEVEDVVAEQVVEGGGQGRPFLGQGLGAGGRRPCQQQAEREAWDQGGMSGRPSG